MKSNFIQLVLLLGLAVGSGCSSAKQTEPVLHATASPTPTALCEPTAARLTAYDEGLNDGHGPELAVDGDYLDVESRWSADGDGRWIQFDLGGIGTVTQLSTAWYKANERTAFFDVETSLDGLAWTTQYTNAQSQGTTDLSALDLKQTEARYIRIVGRGNSMSGWNSLLEAEVETCGAIQLGQAPVIPPTATPLPVPTPAPSPIAAGRAIPESIVSSALWALEGSQPHPLVDAQTLVFVPLEAQHTTPNGNGWRHEYKINQPFRVAMTDTYEQFEAIVKVEMSDGGKTIVAQHHAGGLGTIMKVYVADSSESGFFDSQPANGLFDVYVRLRNKFGVEEKFALGTIESGDSFALRIVNDYGTVTVEAFGVVATLDVEDDAASYLKFGNYLQSQTAVGSVKCGQPGNSASFAECYAELGITEAKVTMTDVSYVRETR